MSSADRSQFHELHRSRPEARLEALPAEFDQDLVELDRLVSMVVQHDHLHAVDEAPSDLAQRVFEMTVDMLPHEREHAAVQPALRLAGTSARAGAGVAWSTWSRLALAASVLLVAGLALWTSWPAQTPTTVPVASADGNGAKPPVVMAASIDLTDLNRFDDAYMSDIDAFENLCSYLLDASEVRSFDDLSSDLQQLVAHLEM